MKSIITGFALNFLLLAVALSANQPPNILLILTDDQGYGDVGIHGNPILKTPHMDRLAREGVSFDQFLACAACSPTRAGLMTGRYHYRTGVTEVLRGGQHMRSDEITIAEVLRDAGYRTGIFGKWHLGNNYPMRPTDQGFEEALVHKAGGIGQAAGPPGNSYFDPILEHNNVSKKYYGYCDDIFADATLEFIAMESTKPFFAFYATNLPHFPLDVPDEMADPYRELGIHEHNARTFGMIANIDKNVGKLLAELERQDIVEDTIVIFLSDNGPRTRRTKNDVYPGRYVANLRGTKTSNYENGIRVPFFIRWPGSIPKGKKVDTMSAYIDVFSTILDAAQIPQPDGVTIDGRSLLPLIQDEKPIDWQDRTIYVQWHRGIIPFRYAHFAARSQSRKLIQRHDDPHSIIHPPSPQQQIEMLENLELYDLDNDPSELNDISKLHPEEVDEMLRAYEDWFYEVTHSVDYANPERIQIGTPHQTHVILSRFDWIGSETLGDWAIESREAKHYRITLRFEKTLQAGTAHLRFAGVHFSQPVEKGVTSVEFNKILLPSAKGRFEAFLRVKRLPEGPHFVDIVDLDANR